MKMTSYEEIDRNDPTNQRTIAGASIEGAPGDRAIARRLSKLVPTELHPVGCRELFVGGPRGGFLANLVYVPGDPPPLLPSRSDYTLSLDPNDARALSLASQEEAAGAPEIPGKRRARSSPNMHSHFAQGDIWTAFINESCNQLTGVFQLPISSRTPVRDHDRQLSEAKKGKSPELGKDQKVPLRPRMGRREFTRMGECEPRGREREHEDGNVRVGHRCDKWPNDARPDNRKGSPHPTGCSLSRLHAGSLFRWSERGYLERRGAGPMRRLSDRRRAHSANSRRNKLEMPPAASATVSATSLVAVPTPGSGGPMGLES
jgi:hypothetical protein